MVRKLALIVTVSAITLLGIAPAAEAQTAPDELAVMEVVNRLFDAMRARDGEMAASVFHPEARLASTGTDPEGNPRVTFSPIAGFVSAVGAGGDPWNEPIFDPEVRIDGNLAQVWVRYRFYRGDTFSHCGFNSFQLARTADGWLIVALADSRQTEGCR